MTNSGIPVSEVLPIAQKLKKVLSLGELSCVEQIKYCSSSHDSLNYPISATVELTYSCHHACRHCMNSSSPKYARGLEKTSSYWIALIREMRSRGLFHIYFSGGETIRFEGYKQVFDACDELGVRYLLVSDLAGHSEVDFINLSTCKNLDMVRVSLDGHDAVTHDYLRGRGAFDATIRGIKTLQDLGINVGIYHSVHRKKRLIPLAPVPQNVVTGGWGWL